MGFVVMMMMHGMTGLGGGELSVLYLYCLASVWYLSNVQHECSQPK